jgi:hypothetical protein
MPFAVSSPVTRIRDMLHIYSNIIFEEQLCSSGALRFAYQKVMA